MVECFRDGNYLNICIKGYSTIVLARLVDDVTDKSNLVSVFAKFTQEDELIKLIKDLKADRDLIAYGISLSGATESDKITEIDGIIRQLSTKFIA